MKYEIKKVGEVWKGICPSCKKEYTDGYYPALSKKDNKTYICTPCSRLEDLSGMIRGSKSKAISIRVEPAILEWMNHHGVSQTMVFDIGLATIGCEYASEAAKTVVNRYPPTKLEGMLEKGTKRLNQPKDRKRKKRGMK